MGSIDTLLYLKLPSIFEHIENAVDQTQTFLKAHSIDDDMAHKVVLLVSEAITNAMEHGNQWDSDRHVTMNLTVGLDRIEFAVIDEGDGFDPSSVEDPMETQNLLKGHGRGLHFMELLADEVHINETGNQVHLVFYRKT